MLSEPKVIQSVIRYLSRPQFSGFNARREVGIQMGSYSGRADIVLYTDTTSPQMVVIVECKGEGITNIPQLHSYLSASDTELGIFANTDNPNEWHYVKNYRSNQFEEITRADFENRLDELRPPPDPQRRRNLMNSNKRRARAALFELKEAVLTVLLEARQTGEGPIQYEPITERLGIPKPKNTTNNTFSLINGVLDHLLSDGLVDYQTGVGWQVTEETASLLDDA